MSVYTLGAAPAVFTRVVQRAIAPAPGRILPRPGVTITTPKMPLLAQVVAKAAAQAVATAPRAPIAIIPVAAKPPDYAAQAQHIRDVAATMANALLREALLKQATILDNKALTVAGQRPLTALETMLPGFHIANSLEQTAMSPPIRVATTNPGSPFSLVPTDATPATPTMPAVTSLHPDTGLFSPSDLATQVTPESYSSASLFPSAPGDTFADQSAQVDSLAEKGDLSAQEVASIKADLAKHQGATPPTSWIPIALFIGLIAVSVAASRRSGSRMGRRGWGD